MRLVILAIAALACAWMAPVASAEQAAAPAPAVPAPATAATASSEMHGAPAQPADAGAALVAGPWEFKVLSFEEANSYAPKHATPGTPSSISPKSPADKIAMVRIQGRPTRAFTAAEEAQIEKTLGDPGKFALLMYRTFKSKAFLINASFALTDLTRPTEIAYGLCQLIESGEGLESINTFNKNGDIAWSFGFAKGDQFEATLIFAFRSRERNPLLVFMPTTKQEDMMGALIHLDTPGGMTVEYGTIDELRMRRSAPVDKSVDDKAASADTVTVINQGDSPIDLWINREPDEITRKIRPGETVSFNLPPGKYPITVGTWPMKPGVGNLAGVAVVNGAETWTLSIASKGGQRACAWTLDQKPTE